METTMETINFAAFLDYFSSYYPILIPCITLLVLLCSAMLDQLRVWLIAYVDEGENGPYKTYIIPLLNKLLGCEGAEGNAKRISIPWRDCITLKTWGNGSVVRSHGGSFDHKLEENLWIVFRFQQDLDKFKGLSLGYGPAYAKACADVCVNGKGSEHHTEYNSTTSGTPAEPSMPLVLLFCLVVLAALLACFKFLPTLTMGVIVGYGVMRTARSIARLSKKFNKHCSDSDAHPKDAHKAPEAQEEAK